MVTVLAPAKLNLHFEILGRRSDGYHDVETVITTIGLFDTLRIEPRRNGANPDSEGSIQFEATWAVGYRRTLRKTQSTVKTNLGLGDLPEGNDNLVVKAIDLLSRRSGVTCRGRVCLVKRIPSVAGLGGGSSDAAAALVGANKAFGIGWSRQQLSELAEELGSDVPFFLSPGGAVCRGRGECIESATDWRRLFFVVVRPPVGLSTKEVYERSELTKPTVPSEPMLRALRRGDAAAVGKRLFNRLEVAADAMTPWLSRIRSQMQKMDVLGHQMTGSGSSYFAVCQNALHARRVANRLKGRNLGWIFCTSTHRDSVLQL